MKLLNVLAICLSVLLLISVGITGYALNQPVKEKETIQLVEVENTYNDTAINLKLDALSEEILKDSNWKADALKLAESDWTAKTYKAIFNGMEDLNISIDEKSDITSVKITDKEVSSFDVEDKDATVIHEVTVKYEDSDGDHKKVKLIITTEIADNEVEDQTIELA